MSLVNNMLRDLDQRRKGSDSSSGALKLMPASEFIRDGKKGLFPVVFIGLTLLLLALGYYWFSLQQGRSEQQLDIQIGSPSSVQSSDAERLIQDLEESILLSDEELNQQEAVSETLPSDSPAPLATLAEAKLETASIVPIADKLEVEVDAQDMRLPQSNQDTSLTEALTAVADPVLVLNAPVESVKEAPEFSNQQLDTIAVQEALRQISNGQTEAAYETLNQFILSNRYAHLSRETYAKLLMSQGRVQDANALIEEGLELAPNHLGFKKVKARLLMGAGEINEAVTILMSRAPELSEDSEYHDLLATAQLSSRDYTGAVISYRGLVQHDQTQGKWWYGFAAAHDQLGNLSQARQAYSRAIQHSNLSANLRRRSQERLGALSPL